jgi:transaldolase
LRHRTQRKECHHEHREWTNRAWAAVGARTVGLDRLPRARPTRLRRARSDDREQDAVVGVTSNPTIFQKAISQGDRYDEQLKELLEQESDAKEVFYHLAARDIDAATDLLRPAWEASGGVDGYVSWEVDPTLAYDRDASVAEARRLHGWVAKPNLYVKIPATKRASARSRT